MPAVRVATDCSGMEAPIQALRNLKVNYKHVMSCDISPAARRTILANFPSDKFYHDVTTRDHTEAPACDVYVAGFPCQPFSTAGLQKGFKDADNGGRVFFSCRDYIKAKKPSVFVLENVSGLANKNMKTAKRAILRALDALKCYHVVSTLANTKEHGIPQSRPRLYIVGIRKDCDKGTFTFPKPIRMPSIEHFLDVKRRRTDNVRQLPPLRQGTARKNVKASLKRHLKQKPLKNTFIVDCDSSTARSKAVLGCSPCLTRSRAAGHWITTRGRRLTKPEMMRLQGMNPTQFKLVVSERQLGQQLGNSMSLNVLERLFVRLLPAAGLCRKSQLEDRWESGKALRTLKRTRHRSFKTVLTTTAKGNARAKK